MGSRLSDLREQQVERIRRWLQQQPFAGRFGRDVSWNMGSVAVLAVAGILISGVIGRYYGAAALGMFNQVFAVYNVASQISVAGLQLSVLRYVSEHVRDKAMCSRVFSSSIPIILLTSILVGGALVLMRSGIGALLHSPAVSSGLLVVVPGMVFFAVNKIFMAVLNGHRRMRAYAIFQALRYVLIVLILACMTALKARATILPLILSGAEVLLFVPLLAYTLALVPMVSPRQWGEWPRRHLTFGLRVLPGSVLTDLNTRIDILMLGMLATDRVVGIYSLASMVIQGIARIPFILMANVNPIISRKYFEGRFDDLRNLVKQGKRLFYAGMGIVAVIAAAGYPLFVRLFVGTGEFNESWPLFSILMLGMALAAGYLPFNMMLNQTGHPGTYTALLVGIVATKVLLNGLLIPPLGAYGAAIASGSTYILGVLYLKVLVRVRLNLRI